MARFVTRVVADQHHDAVGQLAAAPRHARQAGLDAVVDGLGPIFRTLLGCFQRPNRLQKGVKVGLEGEDLDDRAGPVAVAEQDGVDVIAEKHQSEGDPGLDGGLLKLAGDLLDGLDHQRHEGGGAGRVVHDEDDVELEQVLAKPGDFRVAVRGLQGGHAGALGAGEVGPLTVGAQEEHAGTSSWVLPW